ncbi:pirin-like C-terminal cupin domain-containing protein [Achromobacter insuavis]
MVQLWVNLPAKDKKAPAGYQSLLNAEIPVVSLPDDAGSLRVIAGSYGGQTGPARTFTPIDVWDVRLSAGKTATFAIPAGRNSMLVMLRGTVLVNGEAVARDAQLTLFAQDGDEITVEANNDAVFLVLSGEPIDGSRGGIWAVCDEFTGGDRRGDPGFQCREVRADALKGRDRRWFAGPAE